MKNGAITMFKQTGALLVLGGLVLAGLSACAGHQSVARAGGAEDAGVPDSQYIIGPGDRLHIFVWGNPELSVDVPVRPDGRITTPLVEDVMATGKTSSELARDIEKELARYVKTPVVTVTVTEFVGRYSEQIRVVGAATQPKSLPYRRNLTLLDVMIAVGGLSEYAAGNKANVVRKTEDGATTKIHVRLDDLLNEGDISQNLVMRPGDILIIPESFF